MSNDYAISCNGTSAVELKNLPTKFLVSFLRLSFLNQSKIMKLIVFGLVLTLAEFWSADGTTEAPFKKEGNS